MPWQDTRIQEAAAELPVGFPAPLGGGHRAPQGQQELQPGGEGAPTPNVSAAPAVLSGISPAACVHAYTSPLRQVKIFDPACQITECALAAAGDCSGAAGGQVRVDGLTGGCSGGTCQW